MDPDDLEDDAPELDTELLDEDLEDGDLESLDDQDDEPDEGDDADPPPHQQRQPSRAQTRVQRLANEAKEAKDRADRLDRELAEIRQRDRQGPQRSPEELRAERDRRLAGMTAEERLTFLIDEGRQQTQAQLNEIRFATWDANDKADFAAKAARSPALAAIETEVEQRLTELRTSGQNASRETVAKYLLGEKALNKASRARTAGRKREQEGRERQGARPVNGRGDVAPPTNRRTSDRDARRKRLEGMII